MKLTTDLSQLNEREKAMLILFIKAAEIMDELFGTKPTATKTNWLQNSRRIKKLCRDQLRSLGQTRQQPTVPEGFRTETFGRKFLSGRYDQRGVWKANLKNGKSLYTLVRRDENGKLYTIFITNILKTDFKSNRTAEKSCHLCWKSGIEKLSAVESKSAWDRWLLR